MTNYNFTITLQDKTIRQYQATSYQALYDFLYYNPRKRDFEMYDIKSVEIIRRYEYYALSDGNKYAAYINETLYNKLSNEYELTMHKKFKSLDDYIRACLAYNN